MSSPYLWVIRPAINSLPAVNAKYYKPYWVERETDEVQSTAISGKLFTQSGGLRRLRLFATLTGRAEIQAALESHTNKFGLHTSFRVPCTQAERLELPSGEVSLRSGSVYNEDQTTLRITTTASNIINHGIRFTIPELDKVYEVVDGRKGSGNITIKPGLESTITETQLLDFSPLMLVKHAPENLEPLQIGGSGRFTKLMHFIEDI